MEIAATLFITLSVILNSVGFSSQSRCVHNEGAMPSVPRRSFFDSTDKPQSPESFLFSARLHSSAPSVTSSPIAEPTSRARSRSSPVRLPLRIKSRSSLRILGYKQDQVESIRLIPKTNPDRRFEIRKYVFPRDEPIQVREGYHGLGPMPTEERMVLSTSTGDIFAIFEGDKKLSGIYMIRFMIERRVKFNMNSGMIIDMTKREIKDVPLGKHRSVSKNFRIVLADDFRSHD